jgi:N-sulfoglucosamine sulfohydrolase
MQRRDFLQTMSLGATAGAMPGGVFGAEQPLNVLLITADDLLCSSVGAWGCPIPGITPNIDRLAAQGTRFEHGHVTIAVCQPCRECLMTGRYPTRNGAPGFNPIDTSVPTLQEQLHAAGYLNGILSKYIHLAPEEKFCWDYAKKDRDLGMGRDPEKYYHAATEYFAMAKNQGKPFFLMANSDDPHRPFSGSLQEFQKWGNNKQGFPLPYANRRFRPEEVVVPEFLPDIPEVRLEISEYYTSAHRCDETVGAVLRALDESGYADNTLVMFLSDNGMALPYAKTNCYLNSTRTPWIVRWPGVVEEGCVDSNHMISGIDYMPTILDAVGLAQVPEMDGHSFVPVLQGENQPERSWVFTQFNTTSAKKTFYMRCMQDRQFGYIFNEWSDGETVFKNESQNGRTWQAMTKAASSDPWIADRVEFYSKRIPEEFYDFRHDPNALRNLIDNPRYRTEIARMRSALRHVLQSTGDPAFDAFQQKVPVSG